MKLSTLIPPMTIALLCFAVANVIVHKVREPEPTERAGTSESSSQTPSSIPAGDRSQLSGSHSMLIAGVSSRLPRKDDYRLVAEMPWDYRDANGHYRDAGPEKSCHLLAPGMNIVQPLVPPRDNLAGPLGRMSVFSIRLQPDANQGEGLPSVTRGIIADYLRSNQLTIQVTFYSDAKQRLILSPDIKAAFVMLASPEQTSSAEVMIATSIGELRTLGPIWDSESEFEVHSLRTMLLGFRYSLDADPSVGRMEARREFELVCLHLLPDSTAMNPKIAVFATSDARMQFHLLENADASDPAQMAAITSDVRFADSKMLGMYPEAPIVTRVKHRALLSIPVDVVKAQIEGLGGAKKSGGFSAVLDELYYKAMGIDPPKAAEESSGNKTGPASQPIRPPAKSKSAKSGFSA